VLAALRVRQGSVRHAAWTAIAVTMLALLVVPKWLPAMPMSLSTANILPAPPVPSPRASTPDLPPQRIAATTTTAPPVGTSSITRATPAPVLGATPAASQPLPWRLFILLIWATGTLVMASRLMLGWRYAARLGAGSRLVETGLYESALVSTPMTTGVFTPRILVPPGWRVWPADVLRTVRIHESAHVRRRDSLTSLLAHVNRCAFWFHPLSWWLERQIAIAAEEACDDEVVRASGEPRQYAETLLRMADAVRVRGRRVEWQAIGMAGAPLASRIDRVLNGRAGMTTPAFVRLLVAAVWAAVILPGVACSQNPPALAPDPELAAELKSDRERVTAWEAARDLTLPQVAQFEAEIARNPDDLDVTRQLLTFYTQSGQKLIGWNRMVAARRAHLLRIIERHPES
jgi:beta-lactamase regulating signal transducer with metallopeptidase domain